MPNLSRTHIPDDAFIMSAVRRLQDEVSPGELQESFQKTFKNRLSDLFREFLAQESIRKVEVSNPGLLTASVSSLGIPDRISAAVEAGGFETVEDLLLLAPGELTKIPGVGKAGAREIAKIMNEILQRILCDKP